MTDKMVIGTITSEVMKRVETALPNKNFIENTECYTLYTLWI